MGDCCSAEAKDIGEFSSLPKCKVRASPEVPILKQIQNQVEDGDRVKAKLKLTRDKIDMLLNRYDKQLQELQQQINIQAQKGLPDKRTAIYLLKLRKQGQQAVSNLQTRRQVLVKTLNNVAQHQLDKNIVEVIDQSNKYMNQVEKQLEEMNWVEVVRSAGKYKPEKFQEIEEEDPQVQKLYQKLEKQVEEAKLKEQKQPLQQVVVVKRISQQSSGERQVILN